MMWLKSVFGRKQKKHFFLNKECNKIYKSMNKCFIWTSTTKGVNIAKKTH
jgi:hypothetical protein